MMTGLQSNISLKLKPALNSKNKVNKVKVEDPLENDSDVDI